jgi:small nuclear ribonucleoprotein G
MVSFIDRHMKNSHTIYSHSHHILQDKRLQFSLNGNRKVIGTLRGYDAFLNVVLEESTDPEGANLGTVVIRGNSIIQFEGLERVK